MAVTIKTGCASGGAPPACTLEECLAALDESGFEPGDSGSVAHAAQWLTRLAANRAFLGDMAIADLKNGCRRDGSQGYSAQVLMLGNARPGWFMRANIWPSAQEAVLRESGAAAFVYGLTHDHNFDFLTVGYHGPGYRSDHYEVDPVSIIGRVGEQVRLRFVETSVLEPGQVKHYRARRDVHCQYAPDSLSVSINLMHSAALQRCTDQFEYDVDRSCIRRVLTQCTADSLADLAMVLDPGNGRDLLQHIAAHHPQQRLRWSAIRALAAALPDAESRADYLQHQAHAASGWLARRCHGAIAD